MLVVVDVVVVAVVVVAEHTEKLKPSILMRDNLDTSKESIKCIFVVVVVENINFYIWIKTLQLYFLQKCTNNEKNKMFIALFYVSKIFNINNEYKTNTLIKINQ